MATPPSRVTYRHGDLRRALLEAGLALAREGGPEAVTLREATRRAGVVPNAAYRHFASRHALLQAVRAHAVGAMARAMEEEEERTQGAATSPRDAARGALRAVGAGYLRFARDNAGLFRTAFAAATPPDGPPDGVPDPAMAGASGLDPFQLLGAALDRMAACGLLPPERRPGAEYLAWSAVHGLAMLLLDGPVRLDAAQQRQAEHGLLAMVERGL